MPQPTLRDAVLAVQRRRRRPRAGADRERARGLGQPDARRARVRGRRRRDRRRAASSRCTYCLAAGRELALDEITMVLSHPQASGQCARFLRESLPHARGRAGAVDRRRGAPGRRRARRHARGDRAAARRRAATAALMLREDVEDDPGNETRFVWLARAGTRRPRRRAPAKTALVFWGAGSARPGLARALPGGVRVARREPHADRVAAAAAAARRVHVLPRSRGLDGRRGGRRRGRRTAHARRRGACPRARFRRPENGRPYGYTPRSAWRAPYPSTTTGVRAARRSPAARTEYRRHWPLVLVVVCWCSTRRTSRSTSARCGARRCCC